MRKHSFLLLSAILALFRCGFAFGATVILDTDSGLPGEMRQVVEAAMDDDVVLFDPGVNPVLGGNVINIDASRLRIDGGVSTATITRPTAAADAVLTFGDGAGNGLSLHNLGFSGIARVAGDAPVFGGGVIGGEGGVTVVDAFLGDMENVAFTDVSARFGNSLDGGGIVGVYSLDGDAGIGDVRGIYFSNASVTLTNAEDAETGRIWGAGLVSAFSENGNSRIGGVSGTFVDNAVRTATYINGAGLVGAFLEWGQSGEAVVGDVSGEFLRNSVVADTNLSGAGLVGAWSWKGLVEVGDVDGVFADNTVIAGESYLRGGGVIGVRSYTGESRAGVIRAAFIGNTVSVGTSIGGGGIIGLYSADTVEGIGDRANDKTSTLGGIDGALFAGNTVIVGRAGVDNVYALGGVIAASGLNEELVVADSHFVDNALSLTGRTVRDVGGGALYVGTDRDSANPDGHAVVLTATRTGGIDGDSALSDLGAEVSTTVRRGRFVFIPSLAVSWMHEYGDRDFAASCFYTRPAGYLPPQPVKGFSLRSVRADADSMNLSAGLGTRAALADGKWFGAKVNYALNLSGNRRIHTVYAGLEFGF